MRIQAQAGKGCLDDPDLALQVLLTQPLNTLASEVQAGLLKKIGKYFAARSEEIARGGASGKFGNVPAQQIRSLCWNEASEIRLQSNPDPQAIQQAFEFKRVAQDVGMSRIYEQRGVEPCRAGQHTHLGLSETRQEGIQECFTLLEEQVVNGSEARDQALSIGQHINHLFLQPGPMVSLLQLDIIFGDVHLVGAAGSQLCNPIGRQLPILRSQAAEVDARFLLI